VSWFQLETAFVSHPKVIGLSDRAFRLHICALAFAAEHLTDGEIDPVAIRLLARTAGIPRPLYQVKELIAARLWEVSPLETDSYRIHDYAKHQRTKQDVERDRDANRTRQQAYRDRQRNASVTASRNGLVTEQIRSSSSIEKGSIPKGPSRATTNVVDAVQTFLESYCIHLPDEDVVRDELTTRFKLGEQALDEAQETWRKLRAERRSEQ
jgi:hypothetical protein